LDKKRAKEIASSPIMAKVTNNGAPVYIENVNENTGWVSIHYLNQPDRKEEVPAADLIEH
jgi:small acid-soluble spore protein H (minor)